MDSALLEINKNLHKEIFGLTKLTESLLSDNQKLMKENEIRDEIIEKKQDFIEELSNKLILQKIETEHYSNLIKKLETKNKEITFHHEAMIYKLIDCICDATTIETLREKLTAVL